MTLHEFRQEYQSLITTEFLEIIQGVIDTEVALQAEDIKQSIEVTTKREVLLEFEDVIKARRDKREGIERG